MNKFVWFITTLIMFLALPLWSIQVNRQDKTVRVGIYNFKPMIFFQDNISQGLFMDILEQTGRENGWLIVPVFGTWEESLERLQSGEIDLIACSAHSETRDKTMDFSGEYLFLDWGVLYRSADDLVNVITDLNGKTVAALRGSIYTESLSNILIQFGIAAKIETYNEYSDVLKAVSEGKADVGICTKVYGMYLEDKYPRVQVSDIVFAPQKLRYAVKKGKNQYLLKILDDQIAVLKKDKGSYYYQRYNFWLSSHQTPHSVPQWLYAAFIILTAALFLSLGFIFLLRLAVYSKTRELRDKNKDLLLQIEQRNRAESARQESEANIFALIENRNESIWLVDVNYNYILINEVFRTNYEKVYKIRLEKGMNALLVLPPIEVKFWQPLYDAVLKGERKGFEYTAVIDAEQHYYYVVLSPISLGGKIYGVSAISTDVTEQKKKDNALRLSEEELKKAQSVAHVGSWTWHIPTNTLEWSDEMYRIFGIEKSTFSGKLSEVVQSSIHPSDRKAVEEANKKVIELCKPAPMEYRVVHSDGSIRTAWAEAGELVISEDGTPLRLSGIVMDITERKRAEEEVLNSSELFSRAFHANPAAKIITRLKDGQVLDLNESYSRIMGYSRDELIGQSWLTNGVFPDAIEKAKLDEMLGREGRIQQYETVLRCKNGELRQVLLSQEKVVIHNEASIISIFMDITDMKRGVQEMKKSRDMLKTAFESVDGAVFLVDYNSHAILECNSKTVNLLGLAKTDLYGDKIGTIFASEEYFLDFFRNASQAWGNRSEYSADTHLKRQDGTLFPAHCHSKLILNHEDKPTTLFFIFYDISERRNFEIQLIKARDYYIKLFEKFPSLIWRSGTDTLCNYFNNTWLEFTGRTLEQEMYNGWTEGVHPQDFDRCVQIYQDSFRSQKPFQIEYRLRHHSGEFRWIMDCGMPYFDLEGEFAGYIGSCYDIHALKTMEQNLLEFNANLEDRIKQEVMKNREKDLMLIKQSREALMGEMMHNVAHQWRQPLNSIGIIMQNLEANYQKDRLSKEYFNDKTAKIMSLLLYMSHTIDDFRNFFKIDKVKMPFSLLTQIKKSINLVDYYLKTINISIEADIPEGLYCLGYPNEFAQVLLNLFNNAKDIILERKIQDGKIFVRAIEKKGVIHLTVEDNGGGVPEEIRDRIFEPYFTTKEQGIGTGIGLYMSKMIIEKNMDGSINFVNGVQGASFVIKLKSTEYTLDKQ